MADLESLIVLLFETVATCLLLYGARFLVRRKQSVKVNFLVMSMTAVAFISALAIMPMLFGLANFVLASLVFIPLAARYTHAWRL